jgi:hypothetical protein
VFAIGGAGVLGWGFLLASLLSIQGCSKGTGSDIGPKLDSAPTYDYRVLVCDDSGKPIVGAKISVSGAASTATTSHTGRAFLYERIVGVRLLTVDGANAAATDSSRPGTCVVAAVLPDGDELPYVVYLPDHGPSVGLSLMTGVQGGGFLDDDDATVTTRSGAKLTVQAGDTVTFGTATSVEVRTGKLSPGHLPRTLAEGGAAILASRSIYIHPVGVQFATGASLSIPDDLGLATAESVDVYWLDPATGLWAKIGTGAESSGRIVAAPPLAPIRNGGFYSFGKPAIATTTISGWVRDANKFAIPGALIRGPQASTRARADGRFTLPALSRTDNTGVNRDITIEVHGGRYHLPSKVSVKIDKGDLKGTAHELASILVLDTPPATNLRLLVLNRGASITGRRIRASARTSLSDSSAVIDERGMVRFEEIAADIFGFIDSIPRDIRAVYRIRQILVLRPGLDNATNVFAFEIPWRWAQVSGTLIAAVDKAGTGALFLAHVVRSDIPGKGLLGQTDLNGYFGLGVLPSDSLTTVMKTEIGGRTVTSAFTAEEPDIGRIETPLERAPRQFSEFVRFGVVTGELTGVASSTTKTRRVLASGRMTRQDFVDVAAFGRPMRDTPSMVMPTSTSPTFRVGVPAGFGHVAAAEGSTEAGVFYLERLGVVLNTKPVEGEQVTQNIPLIAIPASSLFRIQNGLKNKDAAFLPTDLRFSVAGELESGLLVDLVADVGILGSQISGDDVSLLLPPRPSGIQKYWTVFGGLKVTGGVTTKQCIVVPLHEAADPDVAQLALPTITSPTPGATLPKTGFPIKFILPPECHYGVVQVRSEKTVDGETDVRDWTVVVPRDRTQADIFTFSQNIPEVLVDDEDRTWTVTVSAARIDSGPLVDPILEYRRTYVRILANWAGMKEVGREARAFSSVSQTFETKK